MINRPSESFSFNPLGNVEHISISDVKWLRVEEESPKQLTIKLPDADVKESISDADSVNGGSVIVNPSI